MTAPTKPQPRKFPAWLAWLKISTADPSIIESEYRPTFRAGENITRIFLMLLVSSIVTSAVGYFSAIIFPAVLAYGSAEQAAAAFIGGFLYQVCQARGGPCDVSLLLGGLAVGIMLVFVVGKVMLDTFDFTPEDDEAEKELHAHMQLVEDKLAEIYYALPGKEKPNDDPAH
jgi:hypothetical protein